MQELQTSHPAPGQLAAFGLGCLAEGESAVIEQHLSQCADCRQKIQELPDDSLVCLLQASHAETQPDLDRDQTPASAVPAVMGSSPKNDPPGMSIPRELLEHPRYQVLELVGAGGMGTVYKAQHRLMERWVALKIVNPLLVTKPGAVDRFRREVKAAAQLAHPNIVIAHDAEKVGDMHLLVMEYVEGKTLAQLLHEQGPLPVAQACDYIRQAALGLQHAFQRGMVHRDIKPQNLMVVSASVVSGKGGTVKILDFGLARFVSEQRPAGGSTEQGVLMGSPDYMAPEQSQDAHTADVRADIYSLGCTLYHLLAGQVPFPGKPLLEKLEAHRDRQPIPLTQIRPQVPVELARIVEKMMAKDPRERYQTPAEVAQALVPFVTAGASTPTIEFPASSAAKSSIFRGWTWRLAAAAAVLLAAFWLAPLLLRLETDNGVLIIQSDDPSIQVEVKAGGQRVTILDIKTKKKIDLKAGKYEIELVGGKEGLKLSTNQFTITRGKEEIVRVTFEPATQAKTEPAPLQEWLQGRELLTVAQDGKGMFRTIGAAVDALRPGQGVKILDRGPYRERLEKVLPENVGLVSEVGTRIEIPEWARSNANAGAPAKFDHVGWSLSCPGRLRLAGLEIACPKVPDSLVITTALLINVSGDLTIERCRILHNPRYGVVPPQVADLPWHYFRAIDCGKLDRPGRILVQDSYLEGSLDLWGESSASFVIRRNWIIAWRWGPISVFGRPKEVTIRENVLHGDDGIHFFYEPSEAGRGEPAGGCLIANNVVDSVNQVIYSGPRDRSSAKARPGKEFRIQNNIFRAQKNGGIVMLPEHLALLKDAWRVGHNCYQGKPGPIEKFEPFPQQSTDLVLPAHFLSVDPRDVNYLRIRADGPLANSGAGGDLPKYIGAFPPGPAPKEGDWFSRLRAQLVLQR